MRQRESRFSKIDAHERRTKRTWRHPYERYIERRQVWRQVHRDPARYSALMRARIDGRHSPEYLHYCETEEPEEQTARDIGRELLAAMAQVAAIAMTLAGLIMLWDAWPALAHALLGR